MLRNSVALAVLLFVPLPYAGADQPPVKPSPEAKTPSQGEPKYLTESIRGQVVWLAAALKDQFGISTVREAAETLLAIRTEDGQLLPIVENIRGRAFRKDERLRNKPMEIVARRYERQPLVQVLRVYELDGGKRYEVDYWCDVCAIVMYETGPCSCCQDDNRLRKRLVDESTGESRETLSSEKR